MNKIYIRLLLLACCTQYLSINSVFAQKAKQAPIAINLDNLPNQQTTQLKQTERLKSINDPESTQADQKVSGRQLNYKADNTDDSTEGTKTENKDSKIFGASIFSGRNNSFEPNLKIATPLNYIIGPDDQLLISVSGKSLVNWALVVNPEGNINIPGIGNLNLSSKTIEQATVLLKNKLLANNYTIGHGTEVEISLGNIRSIHVIIIGQVMKPGTYTLPSLATVFNALYMAGGPNSTGSLRQIEIIRNSQIIRTLDVYDFLVKGDQRNNIVLKDQDIIRVPSYRTRVDLEGQVKIPALFEVLPGESLWSILNFASGFTENAYTARIKVLQISDQQRKMTDVLEADYKNYIPLRGDKFTVESIIDRIKNRVQLTGAVFKPGEFELQTGLTLGQLIQNGAGIKEDAFVERGTITRLRPDNSTETISFSVKDVLNKVSDITLQREDIVTIFSRFDLRDKYSVTINGSVRNPGVFDFSEHLKVEDLILKAGGFSEGASIKRIEVARRISNSNPRIKSSMISKVYSIDVDGALNPNTTNFELSPYDIITIYTLPGYEKQKIVRVEGEVIYPGNYTLKNKNDKISDLIKRAGGLTISADTKGASMTRDNIALMGIDKNKADVLTLNLDKTIQVNRLKAMFRDSTNNQDRKDRNNYVGIDLDGILTAADSSADLFLEDGDVLRIPKKQQIVRVDGQVLYPSAIVYKATDKFSDYITNAGGYAPFSLRRKAYVLYANGSVKGTRGYIFFLVHPKIKPGCEIFVPKKADRQTDLAHNALEYTTGLASLVAITLGIISILK